MPVVACDDGERQVDALFLRTLLPDAFEHIVWHVAVGDQSKRLVHSGAARSPWSRKGVSRQGDGAEALLGFTAASASFVCTSMQYGSIDLRREV